MEAEIERLTEVAERLEREAAQLRASVDALAEAQRERVAAERERAAAEAERAEAERAEATAAAEPAGRDGAVGADSASEGGGEDGPDDAAARLVAYSLVLDGRPRAEVAAHLESELGFADHGALLDELYADAVG